MNLVATVPSHKKLQIRTIRDIANSLDAKIVYNERWPHCRARVLGEHGAEGKIWRVGRLEDLGWQKP